MNPNKFHHSAKTPQLYKKASKVLKQVSQGNSGIKLALQNKMPQFRQTALHALVFKTIKNNTVLEELIDSTSLSKESRLDRDLAKVLIFEIIFNKKKISAVSKPIQKIMENQSELEMALKRIVKKPENLNKLNEKVSLPVYVRINNLKTNIDKFIKELKRRNFDEIEYSKETTYERFLELVKSLKIGKFMRDMHLDDVLIFPAGSSFYQWEQYRDGQIVLQDKASCFSPILLNPSPGTTVIDACAAPGMKTSFLAALMKNSGQLLAVELKSSRLKPLRDILKVTGVECAKVFCKDFLTISPEDSPFCDAEFILLDPSCSGSGMKNRLLEGSLTTTDVSADRLEKLAWFQKKMLNHALDFPKVKRIVYSTCSIKEEENEGVIRRVLEDRGNEFELVHAMPNWPRRGLSGQMDRTIRTECHIDLTNGFFVAVIERKKNQAKEKRTKMQRRQMR